jgi:uncharacterized membrane protein
VDQAVMFIVSCGVLTPERAQLESAPENLALPGADVRRP